MFHITLAAIAGLLACVAGACVAGFVSEYRVDGNENRAAMLAGAILFAGVFLIFALLALSLAGAL